MSKRDKINNTIESFEQLGLKKFAQSLRNIQKIQPTFSFKKEQEVFEKLLQIVNYLSKVDNYAILNENYHLPAYSTTSNRKHVYFSQFPLQGYTKQQIMGTGLPDYLKNFVTYYMSARSKELYGPIRKEYMNIANQLSEIATATTKIYKRVYKPFTATVEDGESFVSPKKQRSPSQESIRTEAKNLNSYLRLMQKFILKVQSEYIPLYEATLQEIKSRKDKDSIKELRQIWNDPDEEESSVSQSDEVQDDKFPKQETSKVIKRSPFQKTKKLKDKDKDKSEPDLEDDLSIFESSPKEESTEPSASTLSPSKIQDILKRVHKKANINKSEIISQLENLTIDFARVRDQVESKIADQLKITLPEFRSRFQIENYIKSFLEIDPTMTKIADIFNQISKQDASKEEEDTGLLVPSVSKRYESKAVEKHDFVNQTIRDVVGGRFSFQPYRSTSLHLYSHRDILNAWDYMHRQLASHYNTFLSTVIRMNERQSLLQTDDNISSLQTDLETSSKNMKSLVLIEQELQHRLVKAIGALNNV
jgi:hypothetical protein